MARRASRERFEAPRGEGGSPGHLPWATGPWIVDVWRGGLQNAPNKRKTNEWLTCFKAVSKYVSAGIYGWLCSYRLLREH